eukprot:tig00000042_g15503.t1
MVLGKLRKALAKASARGPDAPDDRYVNYLTSVADERASDCFALFAERARHPDPLRVLKVLAVLHRVLRSDAAPLFAQEVYQNRRALHVAFRTDAFAPASLHEQASFVRAYAEYLEEYILFSKWSSMWSLPRLEPKEEPPADPRDEGAYTLRQLKETPRLQRLFNKCIVFRLGAQLRGVRAAAYALQLVAEDARCINRVLADLLKAFVEMYLGFEAEDAANARAFHDWYRDATRELNELFREAEAAGILQQRIYVPWTLPENTMAVLEERRTSADSAEEGGWTLVEPATPPPPPPRSPFLASPSAGPSRAPLVPPAGPSDARSSAAGPSRAPAEILLAPPPFVARASPAVSPLPGGGAAAAIRVSPASSVSSGAGLSSRYIGESSRLLSAGAASPAEHAPTPRPPPRPPPLHRLPRRPPGRAAPGAHPGAGAGPAARGGGLAPSFAFPARARSSGAPPHGWPAPAEPTAGGGAPTPPPLEAVYKLPAGPPPKPPAGGSPSKAGGEEPLPAYWEELTAQFLRPACEYRLGKQLGKGAFGAVFEASLPGEARPRAYAIKMQLCTPWEVVDNLWEGVVLSQIRHPNVVQVYDNFFLTTSELGFSYKTCLVMEKCDGTVRELISTVAATRPRRHLPEAEVRSLLVQLADMLSFIHSTRITAFDRHGNRVEGSVIHRDMKPENLFMVRRGGRIILKQGDFGISRILTQKDVSTKIGSIMFMAPEVFRGAKYDSKADMFGLGAILYSLCALTEHNFTFWCGADDFDPHKFEPAVGDIKTEKGAAAYSRELSELIYALLDRLPEKRPSAAEILELAWLAPDVRASRLPRDDAPETIVIRENPIADAMLHDRLLKRLLKRSSSWNGKATPKVRVPRESDEESSSGGEGGSDGAWEEAEAEAAEATEAGATGAWGALTTLSEDAECESALAAGLECSSICERPAPPPAPDEGSLRAGRGAGLTPPGRGGSLRRTDRSNSFPSPGALSEGGPSPAPQRPRSYSSHAATTPTGGAPAAAAQQAGGSSHKREAPAWKRRRKAPAAVVSYSLKALLLANVDSLAPTRRPRRPKNTGIQPSATITEGIHDRLTRPDDPDAPGTVPRRSITFDNIAQLSRTSGGGLEEGRRLPSAASASSSSAYGDILPPAPSAAPSAYSAASPHAGAPGAGRAAASPTSSSSSSSRPAAGPSGSQLPAPRLTWDSRGYSLAAPAPSASRSAGRDTPEGYAYSGSEDGSAADENVLISLVPRIHEAFPDRFEDAEVVDALRSAGYDINSAVIMLLSATAARSYDPERKRRRKCARCGAQFTRESNRPGACNHTGTWHVQWSECSSACKGVRIRERPKAGSTGAPTGPAASPRTSGRTAPSAPRDRPPPPARNAPPNPRGAQENGAGQCKHAGHVSKNLFGRLQWSCCHQSAEKGLRGPADSGSSPLGPLLAALSHASSHCSAASSPSPRSERPAERGGVCPKSKPHVPLLPPR